MNYIYLKDYNHITIPAFAIKELQLKGNDLLIYSVIFNATQDGDTEFKGSVRYFEEITGATKKTVLKSLDMLCDREYITKRIVGENGTSISCYKNNVNMGDGCKNYTGVKITLVSKEKKETNENNEKEKFIKEKEIKENKEIKEDIIFSNENIVVLEATTSAAQNNIIHSIIDYLNKTIGTKYTYKNKATIKHINARLSEGFTFNDFVTVIDKKSKEWRGTRMEAYLRPETLFGNKFEGYLNQSEQKTVSQILDEIDI